jgi:HAMP domain-containing protein
MREDVRNAAGIDVTAVSLKLKYAGAAFLVVVLAVAVVTGVLAWQHDVGTRLLGNVAENTARDRVAIELRARVATTAAHAADSVSSAVRSRDTAAIARRLQPFADDSTVSSITVTDLEGNALYRWRRPTPHPGALEFEATEPVRDLVQSIPGVQTPKTFGELSITVEQVLPAAATSLRGRIAAVDADQIRRGLLLAGGLAVAGGLLGAALAWRAGRRLEQPIAALIKGAERIGQGDYTRPVDVRRRDELGELQQALEKMRG